MNTLDFIVKRYKIDFNQPFTRIGYSRNWEIPRLFRSLEFKLGAEIGVAEGFFSEILLKVIPNLKLYEVDPWENYSAYMDYNSIDLQVKYEEARKRLKPYNSHFIRDYSMNAVKRFADNSLDFVYIDGAHDYKHARDDIMHWHKKVRLGGIISGHDFQTRKSYGVIKAVTKCMDLMKMKPLIIFDKDRFPSWMYIKQ